jgi:hypothetical protein
MIQFYDTATADKKTIILPSIQILKTLTTNTTPSEIVALHLRQLNRISGLHRTELCRTIYKKKLCRIIFWQVKFYRKSLFDNWTVTNDARSLDVFSPNSLDRQVTVTRIQSLVRTSDKEPHLKGWNKILFTLYITYSHGREFMSVQLRHSTTPPTHTSCTTLHTNHFSVQWAHLSFAFIHHRGGGPSVQSQVLPAERSS